MPKEPTSLDEVRAFLADRNSSSHTTLRYQADVLENMIRCLDSGDCVVEVGVLRGGLSCQLAFLMENTDKELVLVDIVGEYLEWTRTLIHEMGIRTKIEYFTGTLQQFVETHHEIKPSLVIVDADHSYESVSQDIRTLKEMRFQPVAVVFHDISLRYGRSKNAIHIRVDRAVVDQYLKHGFRYRGIGASGESDSDGIQRILHVSAARGDYHYHDRNTSEGMLVVTDEKRFRDTSPLEWKTLDVWPQGRPCPDQ